MLNKRQDDEKLFICGHNVKYCENVKYAYTDICY